MRIGLFLFVALQASTPSQAVIVDVTLTDLAIIPDSVVIAPGDTVRWTVVSGTHQLHSDTDSFKSWDSGLLDTPDQTFALPFLYADGAGPFFYIDLGYGFGGAVRVADTCWATGTFNESGPPTVADLVRVVRVLGGGEPVPDNIYRLDLNGDCIVNEADAQLISDLFEFGPGVLPQYPVLTCCFPELQLVCPIPLTGDANGSGSLTTADIIFLVMYMFKGGMGPMPCAAAADADCSGHISVADVIYLVSYMFKNGPPPCDVCTLIPETWLCPQ
jgi:plastocyanin